MRVRVRQLDFVGRVEGETPLQWVAPELKKTGALVVELVDQDTIGISNVKLGNFKVAITGLLMT